jgi:hypothetical protein
LDSVHLVCQKHLSTLQSELLAGAFIYCNAYCSVYNNNSKIVDLSTGELYCKECGDYLLDCGAGFEFEEALRDEQTSVYRQLMSHCCSEDAKRMFLPSSSTAPTLNDKALQLIRDRSTVQPHLGTHLFL